MEKRELKFYETPAMEVVNVKLQTALLTVSGEHLDLEDEEER